MNSLIQLFALFVLLGALAFFAFYLKKRLPSPTSNDTSKIKILEQKSTFQNSFILVQVQNQEFLVVQNKQQLQVVALNSINPLQSEIQKENP